MREVVFLSAFGVWDSHHLLVRYLQRENGNCISFCFLEAEDGEKQSEEQIRLLCIRRGKATARRNVVRI